MTISNTLKYIFLLHFLVSLFFGALMFLSPEFYSSLAWLPYVDPQTIRILGASFLGWSFTSLFGFRAAEWAEVKIVVLGEIVFTLCGTLISLWFILGNLSVPVGEWLPLILMGIFFVLFLYAFYEATR